MLLLLGFYFAKVVNAGQQTWRTARSM